MRSRVRFLKHPLHPMLVMLPIATLPLLLLLDAMQYTTMSDAIWSIALAVAITGFLMTLFAALAGLPDFLAMPRGTRAHDVAVWHAWTGMTVLLAYGASAWVRANSDPQQLGLVAGVDLVGTILVIVQGWLGGELVYRHHLGVHAPEEGGHPVRLEEPGRRPRRAFERRDRPF